MSFRDETEALRHRIEQLEREHEELRTERDRAIEERDRALREAAESDAERAARLAKSITYPPGTPVLVEWRGRWWNATVLEARGASLWRIHYDGWSASWDEDVGRSRIVSRDATPPGPRATEPAPAVVWTIVSFVILVAAVALYWAVD